MTSEAEARTTNDTPQAPAPTQSPAPSSKPPVSIQPGSHLDPGAYVRGSFPITIGQNVLIHPRAHLLSIHSPLIIGDGCVVGEKCVLGGPLPTAQQDKLSETTESTSDTVYDEAKSSRATVLEDLVHLHSNVFIHRGAIIKTGSVIESNTVIEADVLIGSHSKICSMLIISSTIPDWTVVWGSTTDLKRRSRTTQIDGSDKSYELVEKERIKAMQREKDGTVAVLRAVASKVSSSNSRSKK